MLLKKMNYVPTIHGVGDLEEASENFNPLQGDTNLTTELLIQQQLFYSCRCFSVVGLSKKKMTINKLSKQHEYMSTQFLAFE